MSHTINVADLIDRDTVHRFLLEMQNHGACYSLVQNGIEVAKIVPAEEIAEEKLDKITPEEVQKRLETLKKIKAFSKKVAGLWSTDRQSQMIGDKHSWRLFAVNKFQTVDTIKVFSIHRC